MKRSGIPEPVLVSLATEPGRSLPRMNQTVFSKDSRLLKVDEFLQGRSLKPRSEQAYRRDLQYFMDWTPQPWENVTHRQVAQFKRHLLEARNLAPSSVNRTLRTLKSFYKWLLAAGDVSHNPTTHVKPEQVSESPSQALEDGEVERIYAAIPAVSGDPVRDRALFSLLLQGLRAEEAIHLNLEDYDGQQVTLQAATPGSSSMTLLSQRAREDLDAYVQQRYCQAESQEQAISPAGPLFVSNSNRRKGQRLTYWGVRGLMDKLSQHTGLDLHTQRGRQTFCANLVGSLDLDPVTAMARSRHRDARSLKRYIHRKSDRDCAEPIKIES